MNEKKYLDLDGLETLASLIKNGFAIKTTEEVATNAARVATQLSEDLDEISDNLDNTTSTANSAKEKADSVESSLSTNYYNKDKINELLGELEHIEFKKVNSKKDVTEANTIYLVPKTSGKEEDGYDEYMLIDDKPEIIGSTDIDLSEYIKIEDVVFTTNTEIEAMFNQK